MNAAKALRLLRTQATPFFSTTDAAAMFAEPLSTASHTLSRLAESGLIRRLRRGHWSADPQPSALAYAAHVTAPLPSYVSLYSALYQHQLISQIPRVIYVASLARTQEITTTIGVYSVHQLQPALFGGYSDDGVVRMASAEKALFDTLYLARARSGRFAGLTELELPAGFDFARLSVYADQISDRAVRKQVGHVIRELRRDLHDG